MTSYSPEQLTNIPHANKTLRDFKLVFNMNGLEKYQLLGHEIAFLMNLLKNLTGLFKML